MRSAGNRVWLVTALICCLHCWSVQSSTVYDFIKHRFNYDPDRTNPLGVYNWRRTYSEACGGQHQSPVDIATDRVRYEVPCLCPRMIYSNPMLSGELKNNGHSASFKATMSTDVQLSNVPYRAGDRFHMNDFHLHYGGVSGRMFELQGLRFRGSGSMSAGSEHTLDGLRFDGELHFVFYNSKYPSLEEAEDKPDGVAVIAILVQKLPPGMPAGDRGSQVFSNFLETEIPRVFPFEQNVSSSVDLSMFFNRQCELYAYQGSLTTPRCHESVVWMILREPIRVTETDWFRLTGLESKGDFSDNFGNYRTTQPMNDRVMEANFKRTEGPILPSGSELQTVPGGMPGVDNRAPMLDTNMPMPQMSMQQNRARMLNVPMMSQSQMTALMTNAAMGQLFPGQNSGQSQMSGNRSPMLNMPMPMPMPAQSPMAMAPQSPMPQNRSPMLNMPMPMPAQSPMAMAPQSPMPQNRSPMLSMPMPMSPQSPMAMAPQSPMPQSRSPMLNMPMPMHAQSPMAMVPQSPMPQNRSPMLNMPMPMPAQSPMAMAPQSPMPQNRSPMLSMPMPMSPQSPMAMAPQSPMPQSRSPMLNMPMPMPAQSPMAPQSPMPQSRSPMLNMPMPMPAQSPMAMAPQSSMPQNRSPMLNMPMPPQSPMTPQSSMPQHRSPVLNMPMPAQSPMPMAPQSPMSMAPQSPMPQNRSPMPAQTSMEMPPLNRSPMLNMPMSRQPPMISAPEGPMHPQSPPPMAPQSPMPQNRSPMLNVPMPPQSPMSMMSQLPAPQSQSPMSSMPMQPQPQMPTGSMYPPNTAQGAMPTPGMTPSMQQRQPEVQGLPQMSPLPMPGRSLWPQQSMMLRHWLRKNRLLRMHPMMPQSRSQ